MEYKNILKDSIFAGMCISLGALASVGLSKPMNGVVFSAGLVMIVLLQLQLFTGNILKVKDGFKPDILLKYWILVYIGNFIGCFLSAEIVIYSGLTSDLLNKIALNKANLPFMEAFLRGIFCNVLVCIAVFLAGRIKKVNTAKILVIMIPVTLFVISGYEHSVANMFYYTAGGVSFFNLIPVTVGNIIGGLLVILCTKNKAFNDEKSEPVLIKETDDVQTKIYDKL